MGELIDVLACIGLFYACIGVFALGLFIGFLAVSSVLKKVGMW